MRLARIAVAALIILGFAATSAFASADSTSSSQNSASLQKSHMFRFGDRVAGGKFFRDQIRIREQDKDPIERLEKKKEQLQTLVKEGKITQEKANAISSKIDARIEQIKEFNSLTLEQKKEKLISEFKIRLDLRVKDGKLTQKDADQMLKKATEKINAWDGTGYPRFCKKGFSKNAKHWRQKD